MIPYDKRSGKIWYNNELVDWADVKLHVLSHGMHYASCVFEGERVYDGSIFKLEEHTARFFHSARRMGFEIPYTEEEINNASNKIIATQKVENGYVRPVAWRGSEMMAISAQQTKIHVAIATWEWGSYFDPKLKVEGIRLNISNWRRPAPNTIPWDTKASGLYMICTLSTHEAEKQGYTDSLMLDHEGNIAEATGANIFFKDKNGEIHTPIPDSFLDGMLARFLGEESKLGELLDPIADKIIVATALILLVMDGTIRNYEVIAAIIILTREILISGLREFLAKGKIKLPVSNLAKLKTVLQMVSIALLLSGDTGNKIINFQDYNAQTIGIILLWLSAALTLFTGYEYMRRGIDHAISEDSKD